MDRFKEGDKVTAKGFVGILIIQGKDEYLSDMTGRLYWNTITLDYIDGKIKANHGESYHCLLMTNNDKKFFLALYGFALTVFVILLLAVILTS